MGLQSCEKKNDSDSIYCHITNCGYLNNAGLRVASSSSETGNHYFYYADNGMIDCVVRSRKGGDEKFVFNATGDKITYTLKAVNTGNKPGNVTVWDTILEDLKNKYLPGEINRIRKCGSYLKTSDSFNKEDSQAYLKYYMQRLLDYKKDEMVFHFKEPNEYESYADFLNDVAMQKYSISFVSFSKDKIEEWRKENKVMLFQISNKDFKEGSCGTDNIHTLYWKELFSSRNMDNTIFKLN
jgi:CRISPR-associated protein Cpf1